MLENALVKDWMSSPVVMARPDLPLSKAHMLMKDHQIRRLPVVDEGKLLGIITIGDVREASPSDATTLSIWELNYLWAQLTVEKVMTRHVRTVHPDDSMIDVAEVMLKHKISGLPVVDEAGLVVGMITESDIFRMLVTSRATALATVQST
jgi:CBS domain-containing protein